MNSGKPTKYEIVQLVCLQMFSLMKHLFVFGFSIVWPKECYINIFMSRYLVTLLPHLSCLVAVFDSVVHSLSGRVQRCTVVC